MLSVKEKIPPLRSICSRLIYDRPAQHKARGWHAVARTFIGACQASTQVDLQKNRKEAIRSKVRTKVSLKAVDFQKSPHVFLRQKKPKEHNGLSNLFKNFISPKKGRLRTLVCGQRRRY